MARQATRLRRDQILNGLRRLGFVLLAILIAGAVAVGFAGQASAHVVPSTMIALDVHESDITAELTLPTTDLITASGIDLPENGSALDPAEADAVSNYLKQHFHVTSPGGNWTVSFTDIAAESSQQYGTAPFGAVTATATLAPPDAADLRDPTFVYDAIIHQVITADIFFTLHSDWAAGIYDDARALGTIHVNTITGKIPTLSVDLDQASDWQGFVGMFTLGISHIAQGTDHQLFLLTLLLPAPLLAGRRRWSNVAPARTAARRITTITAAFTIGHSVTLALGALGLPVPQQPIEALIAVSILVAAVHAIRPIFPGREAWVAGGFGLVHGLAFSETLSSLGLHGQQLVLSLLGFNLGIEVMQLAVVVLVLPPLLVLARTRSYSPLRLAVASLTAAAALGWAIARVGTPNLVGDMADSIGTDSPWLVAALWVAALAVVIYSVRIRNNRPDVARLPQVVGATRSTPARTMDDPPTPR